MKPSLILDVSCHLQEKKERERERKEEREKAKEEKKKEKAEKKVAARQGIKANSVQGAVCMDDFR